jgi:hypothetical protein
MKNTMAHDSKEKTVKPAEHGHKAAHAATHEKPKDEVVKTHKQTEAAAKVATAKMHDDVTASLSQIQHPAEKTHKGHSDAKHAEHKTGSTMHKK